MNKITALISNGSNKVYLKNGFIKTNENSKILLRNLAIYWRYQNIHKYNREAILTSSSGTKAVLEFGTGYWTFNMISDRLSEEGISLTKNKHDNTCRIHCATHSVELGSFGLLLGFEKDTVVKAGVWKDSGTVNINMGLKYITIGCDCVNTLKNFDTNGERSKTIATFPITTEQSLNESVTFYKDVNFEAPVTNGTHNYFNFQVGTNVQENVELDILIECYIK